MNILFLTIGRFDSIEAHSIYPDLLRCFRNHGHEIYTITPNEKKTGRKTEWIHEKSSHILRIQTGDVTGACNILKKGVEQMKVEPIFIKAIKRYFSDVRFELVMYSTPPITFCKVVEYVKKRDGARSYLLLKDIFPQNAVDLGMMSKDGVKSLVYHYFRAKEKRLYALSDRIGCMSQANVDYIIKNNPGIRQEKMEICPNAMEVIDQSVDDEKRKLIREKYGIPLDKKVFVYGGNLGKPQGIPFLIQCLRRCREEKDVHFLIVGSGSEYRKLETFIHSEHPANVKLMKKLPKEDYDHMVGACDVGMIFLDHCFTIPNFPSRILTYMSAKLPVLAVTDPNTDIGRVIMDGGFGWWCESDNVDGFVKYVEQAVKSNIQLQGEKGFAYLNDNYHVERCYEIISSKQG